MHVILYSFQPQRECIIIIITNIIVVVAAAFSFRSSGMLGGMRCYLVLALLEAFEI